MHQSFTRPFAPLFLFLFFVVCIVAQTETKPAQVADCGCESSVLPEILATINDAKFTGNEFDSYVSAQIKKLQEQVIEARKNELDIIINARLLSAEAKKRGTTTRKLIETEVVQKVKDPTEAEAQAFYDENKVRLQGEFVALKAEIVAYLRNLHQRDEAKKFAERLRAAAVVKKLVETATPGDRSRVFAYVNNGPIRSADVEDSLRPLIFSVQEQAYALRKNAIDVFINDTLLTQQAAKQNLTPKALLDTEVAAKVPTITDAVALSFFNENKARLNGDFAQLKPQIISYLQEQEQKKLESSLVERLRSSAKIQVFLSPPVPPVYSIPTAGQPMRGDAVAPVTLVEFTDFQCPTCAAAQPVLNKLLGEYKGKIKLFVMDYPLSQHPEAFKAAEAAEGAREQGKYWEYVNLLYQNQSALKIEDLKAYAAQLALDLTKFDAALDSGRPGEKVENDVNEGNKVGVGGTPTIFVNGRRTDITYEALRAAIEAALRKQP